MPLKNKWDPKVGEFGVDLQKFSDRPLSEILGDLHDPLSFPELQERLWRFIKGHKVLVDDSKGKR